MGLYAHGVFWYTKKQGLRKGDFLFAVLFRVLYCVRHMVDVTVSERRFVAGS